jgi:hypothetical protein
MKTRPKVGWIACLGRKSMPGWLESAMKPIWPSCFVCFSGCCCGTAMAVQSGPSVSELPGWRVGVLFLFFVAIAIGWAKGSR